MRAAPRVYILMYYWGGSSSYWERPPVRRSGRVGACVRARVGAMASLRDVPLLRPFRGATLNESPKQLPITDECLH